MRLFAFTVEDPCCVTMQKHPAIYTWGFEIDKKKGIATKGEVLWCGGLGRIYTAFVGTIRS